MFTALVQGVCIHAHVYTTCNIAIYHIRIFLHCTVLIMYAYTHMLIFVSLLRKSSLHRSSDRSVASGHQQRSDARVSVAQ